MSWFSSFRNTLSPPPTPQQPPPPPPRPFTPSPTSTLRQFPCLLMTCVCFCFELSVCTHWLLLTFLFWCMNRFVFIVISLHFPKKKSSVDVFFLVRVFIWFLLCSTNAYLCHSLSVHLCCEIIVSQHLTGHLSYLYPPPPPPTPHPPASPPSFPPTLLHTACFSTDFQNTLWLYSLIILSSLFYTITNFTHFYS